MLCRPADEQEILRGFFVKWVGINTPQDMGHMFDFISRSCEECMPNTRCGIVQALFNLLTGMLDTNPDDENDQGYVEPCREEKRRNPALCSVFCMLYCMLYCVLYCVICVLPPRPNTVVSSPSSSGTASPGMIPTNSR